MAPIFDQLWIDADLATLVPTPDDAYGVVEDGAVGLRGDRIAWVGTRSELGDAPARLARDVRSAGGGWITPGLIDCHTHAVFGGNRALEFAARLEGESYESLARKGGGILGTVRATREASTDDLAAAAARRLTTLAGEGVTTVEVKSGYGLTVRDELRMLEAAHRAGAAAGVRIEGTLLGLHALPPEFAEDRAGYVRLAVEEMLPAAVEQGGVRAADAFLEGIAFEPEEVETWFGAARDAGLTLRLHADQLADGGGAALAARWGATSADHLEYTPPEAASAMADSGTVAVLLPGAFLVLGETRKPPIDAFRTAGVPMAVATDLNPGSSPVLSLRLAMNLACTLFGLTPAEALAGVTCHAARALGLDDRGRLAEGLLADLAVWEPNHPAELSYWLGGPPPLRTRLVGGRETAPGTEAPGAVDR
ncbi:MAG TPA: imidazolonepropionase [Longimicrobiales bacterium]|nr:imidazolonepropionase [Longimicrobiales bacterium]